MFINFHIEFSNVQIFGMCMENVRILPSLKAILGLSWKYISLWMEGET